MWNTQSLHHQVPTVQYPKCIIPQTVEVNQARCYNNRPNEWSPSFNRDLSPPCYELGPPSSWLDDDEFRESSPPPLHLVHFVPDKIGVLSDDEEICPESLRIRVDSGWVSPSNESLSQSFNDAPELSSCSLSSRRVSLSPQFTPTASPLSFFGNDNRSPSVDTTKTRTPSYSSDSGYRTHQTLSDYTNMNALADYAREDNVSRFLQKEIRYASREDRQRALEQILPEVVSLSCDSHGNYVVQKFVEHGHPEHRAQICASILDDIWEMSKHSFGCRVVQKVIEYGDVSSKIKILEHLTPHLDECIRNDNGNYVVQKLVAELPPHLLGPIYEVFRGRGRAYNFCTHPYGCRIVQRLMGHGSPDFTKVLCEEVMEHASELAQHAWGNYVIQYILESEKPSVVKKLTKLLMEDMMELSCHQLASNVMEKCIQKAGPQLISQFFNKFVSRNNDELIDFLNHQYGNFVVGTLLQKADSQLVYNKLYKRVKRFSLIQEIRANKYGRHVWGKLVERIRRNF